MPCKRLPPLGAVNLFSCEGTKVPSRSLLFALHVEESRGYLEVHKGSEGLETTEVTVVTEGDEGYSGGVLDEGNF